MTSTRLLALLFTFFVFSSCAHDRFFKVQPGMTPDQVTELVGTPEDRSFKDKQEEWHYEEREDDVIHTRILNFKDGKLVSMKNGPAKKIRKEKH